MPTGYRKKRMGLVLDGRICDYGCGQLAHFQFGDGKVCCGKSTSNCLKPILGKHHSEKSKQEISEANMGNKNCLGKNHSEKTIKKMKQTAKGRKPSAKNIEARIKGVKEFWEKLDKNERKAVLEGRGLHKSGKDCFFYGKTHTENAKALMREKAKCRIGDKNAFYGKEHSLKSRKQMRISRIEVLNRQYMEGGQVRPTYNSQACKFFELFDKDFNTKDLYATNGGEYYIKELGYFPDYVNFDLMLIIEWDEERHYGANGNLKERDVLRQKEIQEYFPDFRFVRIREKFQGKLDYSFMKVSR